MVRLTDFVAYTDELLMADSFRDYCPNGLQVEGSEEIGVLVSGVTASLALVEAAIEVGADALLVHHGYFWKGEGACITGMKRRRLARLLESNVSLLAYHLPLDAHPVHGNNVQLARVLELEPEGAFGVGEGPDLAMYATLSTPMDAQVMAEHLTAHLGRTALHVPGGGNKIQRIGWCTGAAQSYIEAAAALGLDAFISGEISEPTVHVARECGIHYYAAGHHATERYGVQALGQHLAERFGVTHHFIDIDNPV